MAGPMSRLFPGERQNSSYSIDYQKWFNEGKRGIIYDIDNTLVPHGAPADERAIELFRHLKEIGFQICLLSNNGEARVSSFAEAVGSRYIYKAGKPKTAGYLKACDVMGTSPEQTLFIGDQIFTDVWGANRAGLDSILVNPINPKEEIQIVLKRIPEKLVLFFYRFHERKRNGSRQ